MNVEELERLKEYSFEIGAIRPPSEGGSCSLLIRVTRNCPWNLCKFCYGTPYDQQRFEPRTIDEIRDDIDAAKAISNLIKALDEKLGGIDRIARLLETYFLYDKDFKELDEKELKNFQSIVNVFNWLSTGGKCAFLQDANSLIMKTNELVEVIEYLKLAFPTLQRITSYARAKTLARKTKTLEEMREIRKAGLSRLHVGLETGYDRLLKYVDKGVTSKEHVLAGKKVKKAGFELSEYWMPGLGGKAMSINHAKNTARVLNEIDPDFVRSRPFVPRKETPLFEEWREGAFTLLSPHEEIKEIEMVIGDLEITGRMCFDHALNPAYGIGSTYVWLFKQDYDGYKFPEEKPKILELAKKGLNIDESLYMHKKDMVEMPL